MENQENQEVRFNYSGHGVQGKKYNRDLTTKDIAGKIRIELKEKYPTHKFSVRIESFSGGSAINLCIMESPFEMYIKPSKIDEAIESRSKYFDDNQKENFLRRAVSVFNNCHSQCNDRVFDQEENEFKLNNGYFITDGCYDLLKGVTDIVESYNFDDSDSQTDYFHVNFYFHLHIGRWDKPCRIIGGGK